MSISITALVSEKTEQDAQTTCKRMIRIPENKYYCLTLEKKLIMQHTELPAWVTRVLATDHVDLPITD
ncbi:hypothetical protein [Mucilaginibacter aquaedulcis]|uniref:hypothetical protein n=1 Tax=Mucilaginibacter aquaedulcis TaxID=1187081 RepID=UPI0025B4ECB5|nr:hypothetical protein [Mucilaginibacter aquaedulcis]MDN3549403.1 hypothetical protein [Mucilaginibacter aquaedulcis]